MTWVVVVVVVELVCLVGADDYGGASMPQYAGRVDYADARLAGVAGHDYLDQSLDASALLDYKYEEESQGNTEKPTKDIIESETWRTTVRNQRGLRRDRGELPDGTGGADAELLPKFRSNRRRYPRHRSRFKGGKSRFMVEPTRRRRARYGRSRDDDAHPMDYLDKADYRDDKNKIVDEDIDTHRETTDKIVRRKPRDRPLVRSKMSEEFELPEYKNNHPMEYEDEGRLTPGSKSEGEDGGRNRGGVGGGAGERYHLVLSDENEEANTSDMTRRLGNLRKTKIDSGFDYYEARDALFIKNKLPNLLRRSSTEKSWPQPRWSTKTHLPVRKTTSEVHAPVRTNLHRASKSKKPHKTTSKTNMVTTPSRPLSESTQALSIAEKSRLSILKKAQKKESINGEPSKKPPVLLQVTSKLPTIVMVEPPTEVDPSMRAHDFSNESPEKLEKVKSLMRHKLVAGAKSIQDLMDNWDDMVCDYVDVSLLDAAASAASAAAVSGHNIFGFGSSVCDLCDCVFITVNSLVVLVPNVLLYLLLI